MNERKFFPGDPEVDPASFEEEEKIKNTAPTRKQYEIADAHDDLKLSKTKYSEEEEDRQRGDNSGGWSEKRMKKAA